MASVVLLVGLGAAAVAGLDRGADDARVVTDPVPTTTPEPETTLPPPTEPEPEPEPDEPGVRIEAPLSPRDHIAAAWTGSELVLWGGSEPGQNDGAAYNPTTDSWRAIPPAPVEVSTQRWSRAAWTGEEVVVFHGRSVATWDPQDNEWRELPDAPGEVGHVVWTGEELVVTRIPMTDRPGDVAGALDPAAGVWRDLPSLGQLDEITLTWTGEELLAFGRNAEYPWLDVEGRALDAATNTWRELSRGPIEARSVGATWVEDRVMVVNYRGEAATYDPSADTWTELAPMPISSGSGGTRPIAVGEHVVIDADGLVLVGDRFGRWTPIPPGRRFAVTADDHLFLIRYPTEASEGTEAGPIEIDHIPLHSLLTPGSIWWGRSQLILGPDITFEAAELLGGPSQPYGVVTTVRVHGRECAITWRWGEAIVGTPAGEPVEIRPAHGGDTWTVYLQAGDRLRLPTGGTLIACDQPDDMLTVARAIVWDEGATP